MPNPSCTPSTSRRSPWPSTHSSPMNKRSPSASSQSCNGATLFFWWAEMYLRRESVYTDSSRLHVHSLKRSGHFSLQSVFTHLNVHLGAASRPTYSSQLGSRREAAVLLCTVNLRICIESVLDGAEQNRRITMSCSLYSLSDDKSLLEYSF